MVVNNEQDHNVTICSLRMNSIGGAKCNVWILIAIVLNPLISPRRRKLNVANTGHYVGRMWQEQTCHGDSLPGSRCQRDAGFVQLLTGLPVKTLPVHFEFGESRLHVGNPFQIRLLGNLKQKNIVAEFGDTSDAIWEAMFPQALLSINRPPTETYEDNGRGRASTASGRNALEYARAHAVTLRVKDCE